MGFVKTRWVHVKDALPSAYRFKFIVQEKSKINDSWNTGYT